MSRSDGKAEAADAECQGEGSIPEQVTWKALLFFTLRLLEGTS